MAKKDYYKVLGISPEANDLEIKRAYKKLAIKYHPDRNHGNKIYENKFKEVKEAYEILSDSKKRESYDKYGHNAFNQSNYKNDYNESFTSTNDFGDIFGEVFGDIFGSDKRNNTREERGSDLQYNLNLNLEDAVNGVEKKIKIPTLKKCNICNGSGSKNISNKNNYCNTCEGSGQIHIRKGFFSVQQTCHMCYGKGTYIKNPCYKCNGNGRINTIKTLSIKIPSGIDNGNKIRLNGEGEAGKNNSSSGDLYIKIKINKHPIFKRKKMNLYCKIPINFHIAALGGDVEVPTLNGKVKLKIPKETQSGKLFRIKGKGVKSINNTYYGDLICKIIVETPVNLNAKQKKIVEKLGKSLNSSNGNKNNPKHERFFSSVKKFFKNLRKYKI
ncbi:molecular chaperone DnaJ [Buchnera aphidicola (Ceratoglyphina bambusae)]|uniref:molecular chaperone DnaJ n=1 Tax=Buchnera aphidicola TaxID=9 RepID=UPI0031B85CD2